MLFRRQVLRDLLVLALLLESFFCSFCILKVEQTPSRYDFAVYFLLYFKHSKMLTMLCLALLSTSHWPLWKRVHVYTHNRYKVIWKQNKCDRKVKFSLWKHQCKGINSGSFSLSFLSCYSNIHLIFFSFLYSFLSKIAH